MKINLNKKLYTYKKYSFTIEHLLLLIILLLGFFLRISFLDNPSFWVDESISSLASLNILEKGVPVFDSGLYYGRALVFHYSQAFSMIVFGVNDFGARFPSVFFGLLTIVLAYLFGKEFGSKESKNYSGLVVALFVCVFFLEVFFSKQARFYQLFQLAFFASLYFLYKSKENSKWLLPCLISFLITVDTQPAGLVLVPFIILHILYYNRKKWLYALVPLVTFIVKQSGFFSVVSKTSIDSSIKDGAISSITLLYASAYFSFTKNMQYLLVLFGVGTIWAFIRNKILTILLIVPSLIVLSGIFFLDTYAFRYAYFFSFPLMIIVGILFVFLLEKYGKIVLIGLIFLIIFPSNLIYPYTYVTMFTPSQYNLNDSSAPEIEVKTIPKELINEMKESTIITHYSPPIEWYIKKPTYVLPFSMDGRGDDQISYDNNGVLVDVYSGALILDKVPSESYFYIEQDFAFSKLKPNQIEFVSLLKKDCSIVFKNKDLRVYYCE